MADTQSPSAEPLPQLASNDSFPIQMRDWRQLHQKVIALREPPTYLAAVTWIWVGITLSAALALILWLPVHSNLPSKAQIHYSYVTPLLIISAIAGLVIIVFSWAAGGEVQKLRKTNFEEITQSMNSIYEPYSHDSARLGQGK